MHIFIFNVCIRQKHCILLFDYISDHFSIFLSLSLQTCQNYGATMIWSWQSKYIGEATRCAGVLRKALVET